MGCLICADWEAWEISSLVWREHRAVNPPEWLRKVSYFATFTCPQLAPKAHSRGRALLNSDPCSWGAENPLCILPGACEAHW